MKKDRLEINTENKAQYMNTEIVHDGDLVINIGSGSFVAGSINVTGDLLIIGSLPLLIVDSIIANNIITKYDPCAGIMTSHGPIIASGCINIQGRLSSIGDIQAGGKINVTGDLVTEGSLVASDDILIGGDARIDGEMFASCRVKVCGDIMVARKKKPQPSKKKETKLSKVKDTKQ